MSARLTREKLGRGWYLLHASDSGRTYEVNAEGQGGMWRVCPYGQPELEELRPTLAACERWIQSQES